MFCVESLEERKSVRMNMQDRSSSLSEIVASCDGPKKKKAKCLPQLTSDRHKSKPEEARGQTLEFSNEANENTKENISTSKSVPSKNWQSKLSIATPSPIRQDENKITGRDYDNLHLVNLFKSPKGITLSNLPSNVVDLNNPYSRLYPVRPMATDMNTSYIIDYGDEHYDRLSRLDTRCERKCNIDTSDAVAPKEKQETELHSTQYSALRSYLIESLSKNVCNRFLLKDETLHIAISLLDRKFSKVAMSRRNIGALFFVGW